MNYIKAPKKVAVLIGQAENRGVFPDGNFLLWERDLLPLSPYDLTALGCAPMTSKEVREEQNGGTPMALPEPTDPRVTGKIEAALDEVENGEEGGEL